MTKTFNAIITQKSPILAPPITGATKAASDAKMVAARAYFDQAQSAWQARADGVSPAGCPEVAGGVTPACAAPSSETVAATYRTQVDENWCGPTSLTVIADTLGINENAAQSSKRWSASSSTYTQESQAANLILDQSAQGTDWEGPDGVPTGGSWVSSYPFQDALNYLLRNTSHALFYEVRSVPDSPSSTDTSDFESGLVYDISYYHFPFAANEYAADGTRLPQQHYNGLLQHWLAPTGYASSGATTVYEDPAWGYNKSVSASSNLFVTAIGGRGYVY